MKNGKLLFRREVKKMKKDIVPKMFVLFFVLMVCNGGISHAQEKGLIAWWKFDENKSDIANDAVGNLPGMIIGAGWASGKFGSGLKFTGKESVIFMSNAVISPVDEITVEAWVFPMKYEDSSTQMIILKPESYSLDLSGGKFRFSVYIHGEYRQVVCKDILKLNAWHYLAGTYSSMTQAIKLYADSRLPGKTVITGLESYQINVSGYDLIIGSDDAGSSMLGMIDEVRIYNIALDEEKVKAHVSWQ